MNIDIFYHNDPDTESRNKADLVLADQAWERVKSWDASIGERAAAYAVMNAMKAKVNIEMGKISKNNKNGQLRTIKQSKKHTRGLYARRVKNTKSKKGRKRNN